MLGPALTIAYARIESIGTGAATKRREFITLLGDAAAAWPGAARRRIKSLPKVGVLWRAASDEEEAIYLRALHQRFNDLGYLGR
jgi:putative tryptophan/tyrosine transport system substrate-binding protein